jgi:probable HAF family extracellular repeat protein
MKAVKSCPNLIVPVAIILLLAIPVKAEFKLINLGTLRGDVTSSAAAINDRGEIVGESVNSNGIPHAFSYRNGRMSELSTDPSAAVAINDAGQIVGNSLTSITNISTPLTNIFTPITPITNIFTPFTNIIVNPLTNILILLTNTATEELAVPVTSQTLDDSLTTNVGTVTNISYLPSRPVFFRQGLMVNLFQGTNSGNAAGINNSGEIVGGVNVNGGSPHAFVYRNGLTTDLGTLSDSMSEATGINNRGDVVGYVGDGFTSPLGEGILSSHLFLYHHGLMRDLGTLGGRYCTARAINDVGEIVGWSTITTSNAEPHAFLYSNGTMTDLGTLGGAPPSSGPPTGTSALSINNWGEIVGSSTTTNGVHAFIYSDAKMTDLNDLVKLTHTNGPPGFLTLTSATGINDWGQIVGTGTYWDGAHETARAFLLEWHPERQWDANEVLFDWP